MLSSLKTSQECLPSHRILPTVVWSLDSERYFLCLMLRSIMVGTRCHSCSWNTCTTMSTTTTTTTCVCVCAE